MSEMSNQFMFFSSADIFSVYPSIFNDLIVSRKKSSNIYLPSDEDWQEKMYYILLDVQKQINEVIESGIDIDIVKQKTKKPIFDPSRIIKKFSPSCSPNNASQNMRKCLVTRKLSAKEPNVWSLDVICKAAKLLKKPKLNVQFVNELEMRKTYSLIYDVFRYKIVLSIALKDVGFYERFPKLIEDQNRVWLMFYEILCRGYQIRSPEELQLQEQLYLDAEVAELASILWELRINLAASISRVRIKYRALNLSELLPLHLQTNKVAVAAANPIVTGWINPFTVENRTVADAFFFKMGFEIHQNEKEKPLEMNECMWDNVCPLFISCFPSDRNIFTKSAIVTGNIFIMQDRTFSYGPAILSRLLDHFDLEGDILQTHIDSPRSTAYLAALFHSISRVNNFYVYGAGTHLREYRKYMEQLGITNIRIFEEAFTSFPLESNRFRSVVGVFANPPNSFSGISDPIDLICSRGGDLNMLKVLTESDISDEGKQEVSHILEEQITTLQFALSRPQVQFLLYQTHSIVDTENEKMVKYVLELVNQLSLDKHKNFVNNHKKSEAITDIEGQNSTFGAAMVNDSKSNKNHTKDNTNVVVNTGITLENRESSISKEQENSKCIFNNFDSVKLPDIDEFVIEKIPDICINQDDCLNLKKTGCFLSLIRRKNITRLNAKYLIKMAENRGLFGKTNTEKDSKSKTKPMDVKNENLKIVKNNSINVFDINALVNRIVQGTHASNMRNNIDRWSFSKQPILFNKNRRECMRYMQHQKTKVFKCSNDKSFWWKYVLRLVISTNFSTTSSSPKPKSRRKLIKSTRKFPFPIKINDIQIFAEIKAMKEVSRLSPSQDNTV